MVNPTKVSIASFKKSSALSLPKIYSKQSFHNFVLRKITTDTGLEAVKC